MAAFKSNVACAITSLTSVLSGGGHDPQHIKICQKHSIYCIVLYCIVLYCIVLYFVVLYFIVFCCIALYCIVLYCTVLDCIALYCIMRSYTDGRLDRYRIGIPRQLYKIHIQPWLSDGSLTCDPYHYREPII